MVTKILAGAQRSPQGEAALQRAVTEARAEPGGAELHLVGYATPPKGEVELSAYPDTVAQLRVEVEQLGAEAAPDLPVRVHVPEHVGRPAAAVLQVAEQEQVDLIVIGLRRRSRVGKLMLGSNAQDILLGANCPVLAVKGD